MSTKFYHPICIIPLLLLATLEVVEGNGKNLRVPGCPSLFDVDLTNVSSNNASDIPKCFCDNATDPTTNSSAIQVNCLYSSKLFDLSKAILAVLKAKEQLYSIYMQEADFSFKADDVPDEYFSKLNAAPKQLTIVNCLNDEQLSFAKNAFKGLDHSLTAIHIERCRLNQFPAALSKLANLEGLVLRKTEITTLKKEDLSKLQNLKIFELTGSEVVFENGALAELTSVESLKLSTSSGLNSSIFDEIAPLSTLTSLDLSGNNIKALTNKPFSKLTKLHRLILNFNFINAIPKSVFVGLSSLASLDLRVNLITNIETGAFDPLTGLSELQLAGNYLTSISQDVFRLPNLTKLDFGYNELTTLKSNSFKNVPLLRKLNLDKNEKLSSLDKGTFDGAKNLKNLNLSYTNLTTFDGDLFKPTDSLFLLDLSGTKIKSLTKTQFVNLRNLTVLYLRSTALTTLPDDVFSTAKRLRRLDVSGNKWTCDKKLKGLVKFLQQKESNVGIAARFRTSTVAKCWLPEELRDLPLVALNLDRKTV